MTGAERPGVEKRLRRGARPSHSVSYGAGSETMPEPMDRRPDGASSRGFGS